MTEESLEVRVARMVRMARAYVGISQKELAERSDCCPSAISSYERGKTMPTMERLLAIAMACGHSLHFDIIYQLPPPEPSPPGFE